MEQLKKTIEQLTISDEDKALIFQQIKAVEKTIAIAEFKYNRTVLDKAAITNVLNASIQEIEKQKKDIEAAKNEISQNLIELDAQKKLIEEKNVELNKAINKLKSTQAQLIQAEKMASLGELTAGIAHEIQNPLNFVNNFSELSKELIGEMNDELAIGNWQLAKEIAGDVEHNLEKINHHGKRAADIVKGMLQHSRTSTGLKEPTDINALADEYLRLAYHGFKAKDKSFKAQFKTDFDPNLPKINLVLQDIGRVLLNLINNAFYAVKAPPPPKGGIKETQSEYKPLVIVKTSYLPPSGGMTRPDDPVGRGGACLISVADNGPGIPDSIKDKIFQPFFTTKPTGQGTGLGLSLSYDIVKAHGGELKVDSQEGIGTVFSVILKNKDL